MIFDREVINDRGRFVSSGRRRRERRSLREGNAKVEIGGYLISCTLITGMPSRFPFDATEGSLCGGFGLGLSELLFRMWH
ncbi:hypothetical protein BHE74_00012176 [Ensete ventricosum]|nr:hypothetical protein BHE74_00012176 [Ensete ventricosum]